MKVQVFLIVCILAINSARGAEDYCSLCNNSMEALMEPSESDRYPLWSGCSGELGGFAGLLEEFANLFYHVLENIDHILSLAINNTTDNKFISNFKQYLNQVQMMLVALISGPFLTDGQVAKTHSHLEALMGNILHSLNTVLDKNEALSWPCTHPYGLIRVNLHVMINTVLNGINGSWSHDQRLLLQLLNFILAKVSAISAEIVSFTE